MIQLGLIMCGVIGVLWVIRGILRQISIQLGIVITVLRIMNPQVDAAMDKLDIDCMGMKGHKE